MTLSFRAAVVAAVTFGAAALVAATAPGLAGTPDATVNPVINDLKPTPVPSPAVSSAAVDADARAKLDPALHLHAVLAPKVKADDADDGYDSLADAVADQDMPDAMDGEMRCLATSIYFEAKGEPLSGQLAVAKVILNRTKSGRFPGTVCGVVLQPHQFSFVRGKRLPSVNMSSRAWRTAVAVAQVAMDGSWDSPVPGALFFHARYVAPGWRMAKVGSVGNHIFYR